jgi:hypothetical protein
MHSYALMISAGRSVALAEAAGRVGMAAMTRAAQAATKLRAVRILAVCYQLLTSPRIVVSHGRCVAAELAAVSVAFKDWFTEVVAVV